jgi:hypothetical protein
LAAAAVGSPHDQEKGREEKKGIARIVFFEEKGTIVTL